MWIYLGAVTVVAALALLIWDLGRRRARSDRLRRELEPYAKLGEGMEGVAHDARHLLHAARLNLERLTLQSGESGEVQQVSQLAMRQLAEAEAFLKALGSAPDMPQDLDVVAGARLVIALHSRRRQIDHRELGGALLAYGTPRDLSRLISNLLLNSLEHGSQTRVRSEDSRLLVENRLLGPAPDDSIYEPRGGRRGSGRGVGLPLCRELSQRLQAELSHSVFQQDGQPWIRFSVCFEPPGR